MAACLILDWHLKISYDFLERNLKHKKYLSEALKKTAITDQVFITVLSLLLRSIELC